MNYTHFEFLGGKFTNDSTAELRMPYIHISSMQIQHKKKDQNQTIKITLNMSVSVCVRETTGMNRDKSDSKDKFDLNGVCFASFSRFNVRN